MPAPARPIARLLACVLFAAWASHARGADPTVHDTITQIMEQAGFPGLAAAVVVDDQVVWERAYGWANIEAGERATRDTLWTVASTSKPNATLAIMRLVDEGLLDLDADVNTYLPFHMEHPRHPGVPITTRQLLLHTAGIKDDWAALTPLVTVDTDAPPLDLFLRDYLLPGGALYNLSKNYTGLGSPPGTRHLYSNVGYALAVRVAESVIGGPLPEYWDQHFASPLGLDAGWRLADVGVGNVAQMYARNGDGTYTPQGRWSMPFWPASNLRATASDLGRLLRLHINRGSVDGVQYVSTQTMAMMQQQGTTSPFGGVAHSLFIWGNGSGVYYGHSGYYPGARAEFAWDAGSRVGVAIAVNADGTVPEIQQILYALFEHAPALACFADCNGDGVLNVDDIDGFVEAFLAGGPGADADANQLLNIDDLDAFVGSYLSGCP